MPDNHNSKPRCEQCKAVLVKGEVLEGLAKIDCGRCHHVNVISIKPQSAMRIIEEEEIGLMEDRFEKEIEIMKQRFGGLHKVDEDGLRVIFNGEISALRQQLSSAARR